MKQIRKISNLVAEELKESLDSKGIILGDAAFESKVSRIVNMISEAVEEEDDDILEDASIDQVFLATQDTTLGGVDVAEGEYVEIDEIDGDEGTAEITVYTEDGDVKEDEVTVSYNELTAFTDTAEPVEFDDEDIEEGVHVKGGKKVKVSAAVEKLKAKLKAKKGNGVNKFTIKNGKIVKKSAEQIKADKKKSKVFAKQMKKFASKRNKSLKKAHKLNSGKCSGSEKKVCEGFDITSNGFVFSTEAGDIISYNNGKISVVREGVTLIKGLEVCEEFMSRCVSEGVVEDIETSYYGAGVDEASILTFKNGRGYVFVSEGSEIVLGNRIRARAFLADKGYTITSNMLDNAADGGVVTL